MSQIISNLTAAQNYAMSVRPKVGGFPVFAEALRQAGVVLNRWSLPSCQSIYSMNDGAVVQQGTPLAAGTYEVPKFSREDLIAAIRDDQQGNSTFPEFLNAIWKAGVMGFEVDFIGRKVSYYGANSESYFEEYPAVHLPERK